MRKAGYRPARREVEGRWTLLDYRDIVVHIHIQDDRQLLRTGPAVGRLVVHRYKWAEGPDSTDAASAQ